MDVKLKEIVGLKGNREEPRERNVDEELEKWLSKVKAEKLERAKWLELEEWLKRKELSIAEMEKRLEELKGLGGASILSKGIPKLSKEELEIVNTLLKMSDEDRVKALQLLMMLKGGLSNALLPLFNTSKDEATRIKEFAESFNAIISAAKNMMPSNQGGRDELLMTLLTKYMDLVEKRLAESKKEETQSSQLNQTINELVAYAVKHLLEPKGSDLEYMANLLPKLREVATLLTPSSGGSSLDVYKIWLEMRRIDQEYEKWKTELAMKQQAEERKLDLIKAAIDRLDLGRIIGNLLSTAVPVARPRSNMPTILCDPKEGGCGAQLPVPSGVKEVVCARCGKAWAIGEAEGEASKGSG